MTVVREMGTGIGERAVPSMAEVAERLRAREGGFSAGLDRGVLMRLLEGATVRVFSPGSELYADDDPHIGILVDGVARTYLHAWDGRQFTIRHTHGGAMLGKSPGFRGRGLRLRVAAETRCVLVELDRPHYFEVLEEEPRLTSRVHAATVALLNATYDTLAVNVFGTVRDRLAHALLEHSAADDAGRVIVDSTQQELADDIGSTREVVSRALRDLATLGLVATAKGAVVLLDPAGLGAVAQPVGRSDRALDPRLTLGPATAAGAARRSPATTLAG